MDVAVWLRSLGLGKYKAAFRGNDIDETVVASLTHENLKELGVASLGHRGGLRNKFWPCFIVVILFAFVLRFGMAVAFPNLHRPDEVFQNLEPAFRMWSGGGVVTWEWREGLRSPMFPGFLAGLISMSVKVGLGAAGYIAVIAAAMSLFSTGVVAVGFLCGWRQSRWEGAVICGLLCAVWPDLVYFGPKPLAEVQAGNLLIIAVYVAGYANGAKENDTAVAVDWRSVAPQMFMAGLLLGLVFCLRVHLAPALLLIAAWACRLEFGDAGCSLRWAVCFQ